MTGLQRVIVQYRFAIGMHALFRGGQKNRLASEFFFATVITPRYIYYTFYHKIIIAKSGDVHKNPGPRSVNDTVSEICLSYLNVRSIFAPVKDGIPKLDGISILASTHSIDIFGVGETWLDQSIADEDLRIHGFQLPYCRDRNRHGGGVAVFISETLSPCRCPQFEPDGLELE